MPKTITRKRIARAVRKGINAGKNQSRPRRTRSNGTAEKAARIIANSLFALTLKERPAIEIADKLSTKKQLHLDSDDDFYKIYKDLLKILHHAIPLITGEKTKFDPLTEGFDIGFAMHYIIKCFENNIQPKGYDYSIDKDGNGYYFTIYKECDFKEYWHAFEIQPVVHYLKKNKALHDLFISFIRSLMLYTDIQLWWQGTIAFADEWLEERIVYMEEEGEIEEPEDLEKAKSTLHSYKQGEAKKYQNLLTRAATFSPEQLLQKLQRFNARNKVVIWMKEACVFMQLPGNMSDFHYPEFIEDISDGEGLHFPDQASIIWAWDEYATMAGEWMDDVANNCGVIPPLLNFHITTETKSFDFAEFDKRSGWPHELTIIQTKYNALVESIKK